MFLLIHFFKSFSNGQMIILKTNVCIIYTQKMNYYCEEISDEKKCLNLINKDYNNEKVLKVWFYYNRLCREFGYKAYID